MPTGKTKNGDAMENVFKGVALVVVGLVAAIIVCPFTHELGKKEHSGGLKAELDVMVKSYTEDRKFKEELRMFQRLFGGK